MKKRIAHYFKNTKTQSGLTTIELTVVLSIFAILSGTLLFNFSKFNDNIAAENLSQDIAMRIKQAQNAAISGLYPKLGTTGTLQYPPLSDWRPSYGVYFDMSTPKSFVYFFDRDSVYTPSATPMPSYRVYDGAGTTCQVGSSECLDEVTIATGEQILDLCHGSTTTCGLSKVALLFSRPFPDMVATDSSLALLGPQVYTNTIYIKIGKAGATTPSKIISISPLGQIAVQ